MRKQTLLLTLLGLLAVNHNITMAQAFSWAKSCDDAGKVIVAKVAMDTKGNSYVAGSFSGTVMLGATTITAASGADYCLIKYDSLGHIVWVRNGGGTGNDGCTGVCTDAMGNIYLAGHFHHTAVFGATTLSTVDTGAGSADLFVAKYDSTGTAIWAKQSSGYCGVGDAGVFADAAGNVYVAGQFTDSMKLDAVLLSGAAHSFFAKYDGSGHLQWARQSSGPGSCITHALSADNGGNIYVTGFIAGKVYFGTTQLISSAAADVFVAKYSTAGDAIWARRPAPDDTSGFNEGTGIVNDANGDVYVTGSLKGNTDFGSTTLSGNGMTSVFVARYDTGGNALWAISPSASTGTVSRGAGIAVNGIGNLLITGEYAGTLNFGTLPGITCVGIVGDMYDVFVAKLNTSGTPIWAATAGGSGDDQGLAVAARGGLTTVVGGYSAGAAFGSVSLTGGGASFIAQLTDTLGSKSSVSALTNTGAPFTAYPVPASGTLYVALPANAGPLHFEIADLTGRTCLGGPLTGTIDVSALHAGLYLLKITGGAIQQTQMISIK